MALLLFNDIITIVFVSDICFGPIRVDLDSVGKPPGIIPARLKEAAG